MESSQQQLSVEGPAAAQPSPPPVRSTRTKQRLLQTQQEPAAQDHLTRYCNGTGTGTQKTIELGGHQIRIVPRVAELPNFCGSRLFFPAGGFDTGCGDGCDSGSDIKIGVWLRFLTHTVLRII